MKKLIALILVVSLTAAMFAGCGNSSSSGSSASSATATEQKEEATASETESKNIRIGMTTIMSTISYFVNAVQGVKDSLHDGDTVEVFDFTADVDKMVTNMEDIVTQDYDVMVYTAFSQDAIEAPLADAKEAGVVCINYDMADSKSEEHGAITAVFPNDYQIGYQAGEYLAKINDGKGKYGIYLSPETATSDSEYARDQGFMDALSQYPDMSIEVNLFPTSTTPEDAMAAMDAALQAHPDLDGFFSVTEWVTTGVVQSCKTNDMKIDVVTVDVNDTLLGYLKDGYVCACIDLNAYGMGQTIAQCIYDYLDGKTLEATVDVPTVFVTEENMADYEG